LKLVGSVFFEFLLGFRDGIQRLPDSRAVPSLQPEVLWLIQDFLPFASAQ